MYLDTAVLESQVIKHKDCDPLGLELCPGDKNGSICILLHVDCQLNQHYLLKNAVFFATGWF